MKYLKGTQNLELTLLADNMSLLTWYVDACFAVHEDYKGHNGTILVLGKGAVTSFFRKQKCNAKRSTKAELVVVNDALLQVLWT